MMLRSGRAAGLLGVGLMLTACTGGASASAPSAAPPASVSTRAQAPSSSAAPTSTVTNVYAAAGAGLLVPAARAARPLVYVPNSISGSVDVIDPRTYRVIRSFRTSATPQHVVPSWDLKTLWVNESGGNRLTAINPRTGQPGRHVSVADPYNLYFTPDGRHAMVMAERLRRIDFRDPHTMALQHSLRVPCKGVNHADFTADLRTFVASCEFSGSLIVVSASGRSVTKVVNLNRIRTPGAPTAAMAARMGGPASGLAPGASSMPQDVRLTPDGHTFVVADMLRGGLWLVDATTFAVRRFLPTGRGAHGIYPSRDGRSLYVSNRDGGSVSVVDAARLKVVATWRIPGGGSPDMGGVTADGRQLWLSGRYNSVVYVFDTRTGRVLHRIRVHGGPHGLCVWPQPGQFSLGHTGNLR
jgi:YVTN family beta-propeller protein